MLGRDLLSLVLVVRHSTTGVNGSGHHAVGGSGLLHRVVVVTETERFIEVNLSYNRRAQCISRLTTCSFDVVNLLMH